MSDFYKAWPVAGTSAFGCCYHRFKYCQNILSALYAYPWHVKGVGPVGDPTSGDCLGRGSTVHNGYFHEEKCLESSMSTQDSSPHIDSPSCGAITKESQSRTTIPQQFGRQRGANGYRAGRSCDAGLSKTVDREIGQVE